MIYGKSLDYLKLFWGSGKTWWNEAKQIVTMKVTMKKKRLVPVLMLKKKKIHWMDSLCVIVSKRHDKRLQKAIIFTRNIWSVRKVEVRYEEVLFPSSYYRMSQERKKKKEKKNACSYNVDTKRCTFCTLNLYKHCLFSCSSYFKCQGGCCFQQGNVSGCTCQASSSLWCQRNNFERGARKQHHLPAHDLYKSFQCYLFLGLPGKLKHKERRGEKHI